MGGRFGTWGGSFLSRGTQERDKLPGGEERATM